MAQKLLPFVRTHIAEHSSAQYTKAHNTTQRNRTQNTAQHNATQHRLLSLNNKFFISASDFDNFSNELKYHPIPLSTVRFWSYSFEGESECLIKNAEINFRMKWKQC